MDRKKIPLIEEITEDSTSNLEMNQEEFQGVELIEEHEIEEIEEIETTENDDVDNDRLTKQFINGKISFNEYSTTLGDEEEEEEEIDEPENEKIDSEGETRTEKIKTKRKCVRKKKTLPQHLRGLMGEANLRLSRNEIELSTDICLEIIRRVPSAPEPFQTLSLIYENTDPEKSLQFALIAAHLNPKDQNLWEKLAERSDEAGNKKQAITCYTKAIANDPTNVSLYKKRAKLQDEMGDMKGYFKGLLKLVNSLKQNESELINEYALILAKRYTEEKNYEQAYQAMENVFTKCKDQVTDDHVNIMLDALIAMKRFSECLAYLTEYTNINIVRGDASDTATVGFNVKVEKDLRIIEKCEIPDDVKEDHKAKCLIVLIELGASEIAIDYIPNFIEQVDPECAGDLHLDVAETFMAKKLFEPALALLKPLLESRKYNMAGVWLRHAECLIGCGNIKEAMESYKKVRELSPQHIEARIELSKLYEENGQLDTAIDVLYQDSSEPVYDVNVIYKRTLLLKKVERWEEFLESGMLLISRHCLILRSRMEMTAITRSQGLRQRQELLNLHRLSRGESLDDENTYNFINSEDVPFDDEYELFLEMVETACRLKNFGLMQKMCFSAMTSKKFDANNQHILYLCLIACVHCNDSFHGFNLIREIVRTNPQTNYWNFLNVIIQRAEDSRHNRFIMRLLGRATKFSQMHILHANNCLVSGTYKYALNDYIAIFKVQPSALLALLVGVTHLQMACQKFAAQKNQIIVQGSAFMQKYSQMRGKDLQHEVYYNMGRFFHQLGLLSTAVHYYKLVLETPPSKLVQDNLNLLDLVPEAAFNLHLIYLQSGNPHLARMYLDKYVVV